MRPGLQLSSRALTLSLMGACFLTLGILLVYTVFYGRGHDKPLPVEVSLESRLVDAQGGRGKVMTDVVVVRNLTQSDLPRVTLDLNGQYFLYQDAPLKPAEDLVVPLSIFKTKSNQSFVPGRYPVTEVNVTAQLPSGARGVAEVRFEP
ncbi:hypothetical protein [Roseimaritima sediminicola]|uniref:hypothetical protein n=1 Tax=Roseimaritima sediminicola TaxID=2662066 RepID=UPI0012985252|nr:hypothetical protein [Roseimaritima sediminicola]